MPIKLPSNLPAYDVLTREGVMVMPEDAAEKQDIRPLKIGLLNLMPKKIQTENQFARLIGATPLQIDLHLIRMTEHATRNTAAEHMAEFYRPFEAVKDQKFDGLIITGAPIEHLEFEDVTYWDELKEVMEKSEQQGMKTFDAALFDLYKDGKISYEEALKNADSKNNLRLRIQLAEDKIEEGEVFDEEDTGILSLVSKEERRAF